MIRTTRRGVLAGALAVPTMAGFPHLAFAQGEGALLLHDPSLSAGRILASAHPGEVLAIEGDRIRFARAVFARKPLLVIGISRPADALLIEDVGRELGYVPVSDGMDGIRSFVADGAPAAGRQMLGWVLAPKS